MFDTHSLRGSSRSNPAEAYNLESLEVRTLLSVPAPAGWVPYAQLVNQAAAAIAYPYLDGSNQNVAIVDRGINYNNAYVPASKIAGGYNFRDNNYDIRDDYGHGTGVASIVAANPYDVGGYNQGVAVNTHIVDLKQENGTQIKAALDWIIQYHSYYNIQVVNLTDFINDVTTPSQPQLYLSELATLKSLNIFVSTPVGNGELIARAVGQHSPIVQPALSVFGVGGSTLSDVLYPDSRRGVGMQLAGPAENVTLAYYVTAKNPDGTLVDPSAANPANDNYSGTVQAGAFGQGTSWASSYVAGTAVLLKQINPDFTPDQIGQILTSTGGVAHDDQDPSITYPRLDILAALNKGFQMTDDANLGNQSSGTATPLAFRRGKAAVAGMKLTVGHPDYYSLNVAKKGTVKFSVSDAGATPFAEVFDANNNPVGQVAVNSKKVTGLKLTPGKYYLYVTSSNGQTLPGTYSVAVTGSSGAVTTPTASPAAFRAEVMSPSVATSDTSDSSPAASTVLDRVKNSSIFG